MPKILTLSGSVRSGSYNQKLAHMMGALVAARGAEVDDLDLADFDMPIFNEDIEQAEGVPEPAMRLAQLFADADAIFIATPEYNGSMTPLLTNTLTWVSRSGLRPFASATFGLGSVSSGPISGVLSLSHLRDLLMKTQALIAPTTLWVGFSERAFTEDGRLAETTLMKRADALADQLMSLSR